MENKEKVQAYTEEELAKVRHYLDGPLRLALKENVAVIDRSGVKEGDKVLDFGCGTGFLTIEAAKRVGKTGKVVAVDMRQEMINVMLEKAEKENLTNIQAVCGLVEDVEIEEDGFDAVVMSYLLHENPECIADILKVAMSVLKPGGKIVTSDFVKVEDEERNLEIEKWHQGTDPESEEGEVHFVYKLNDFKNFFIEAGLKNVEAEPWFEFHGIISGQK